MSIVNAAGNILNKTELTALTTPVVVPDKLQLTANVYETYTPTGAKDFQKEKRLLFRSGQVVTQKQVDDLYSASAATVTAIAPANGLAAGNTAVTLTGTGLAGVEGVTFGGAAATQVVVVDDQHVTCRTPAHAAGAVTVVVQDDAGDVTKPAFYTYT
jgi:hypothetical protein